MPHPLDGLSQAIHDDHVHPPLQYFLISNMTASTWDLHLFADLSEKGDLRLWKASTEQDDVSQDRAL